jgi:hypothetical protein
LPLLAAVIAVPVVAGFAVGGPGVGLAIGALVATTILIVAARMTPHEEIEVEHRDDERRRVLVVATEAIDEPPVAGRVADVAGPGSGNGERADVLVLAPAINTPAAHWASDLREARFSAQRRLALSVGTLAAAGVEARGLVGDSDTVQAVEDTLRDFAADEVVFVTGAGAGHDAVVDVDDRLDLPVREVQVGSP